MSVISDQFLAKPLRSRLETTVKSAREVAERGVDAAFGQLSVGKANVICYLTDELRILRRAEKHVGRAKASRS